MSLILYFLFMISLKLFPLLGVFWSSSITLATQFTDAKNKLSTKKKIFTFHTNSQLRNLEALALVDTLRFDDEEVMDLWSIFLFFVICFLLMSCCGYCCTKKRRGAVLSEFIQ
uniref:Uncharacterized protein n=1 Tax=Glossina austeni TaxID=7395 RepID=A0A1A9VIE4_GLOAU